MERCYYCNEPATRTNKVLPAKFLRYLKQIDPDGLIISRYPSEREVPSCYSCDEITEGLIHRTMDERRGYIAKVLQRRNKKLLKGPSWSQGDIEELSGTLRVTIEETQKARLGLIRRLNYLRCESSRTERNSSPS